MEIVEYLINSGGSVEPREGDWNPLMVAAASGELIHHTMIDYLAQISARARSKTYMHNLISTHGSRER